MHMHMSIRCNAFFCCLMLVSICLGANASGRRLRDTQLNGVETHLAVGDVLAYDVSLGIASAVHTDQATGSHTNATTVAISQAAGLNNASCLITSCAMPTADSTASTARTTDKSGHQVFGGNTTGVASGGLKAATQSNVNSTSISKTSSPGSAAITNVQSESASVKNATDTASADVSSAASAGTGTAASQQSGSTDSYGSASTEPNDNPASCTEVVQTATGSTDLSKTQPKDLVDQPDVLHCYLVLAAQKGRR